MSGVYQALRKKSTFQVFEDCTSLRNKLTEYILQDFDLNGKLKDKHLFFLEEERKTILTYVRNVSTSIAMANSIYITNLEEYKERRLWQDRAIGWCGSLKQELQYIIETLNKEINTNKYTDSKEELQELLEILKEIVKPLHIIINENKCTIQRIDKGFHYLQNYYYLTESGRVVERINKKKVIRMRRKLKSLKIMVENGERTFNSVLNMYKGWIGNNKKTMSKIQIKNMDSLFLELFRKEIYGNYNLK